MAENRININIDEMKSFLRITSNDEDDLIQELIDTAEEMVWDFLNNDFSETDEETGIVAYFDIPKPVEYATKQLVAYLYERRTPGVANMKEGEISIKWETGRSGLPLEIEKRLLPYRRVVGL